MWSECWPASRLTLESRAWVAKSKAPAGRSLVKRGQDFALVASNVRLCSNAIWVPVWLLYLYSGKPTRFPVFFTDYPLTKRTDHGRLEQSCYYSGVFFTSSVYAICNVSPPSRQSGTLGPSLLLHIFANNPQPEAISPEFLFLRKTSNILKLLEPPKTCYGCSNKTSEIECSIEFVCPNCFHSIELNLVRLGSIIDWPRRSVLQDLAKVELFKLFHPKGPRILIAQHCRRFP